MNWISTANGHGCTEGGSSGSPLFNAQKRIIGQLYGAANCSNPDCSDPDNDVSNYGKIFSSWNLGVNSDERLMDWLDPNASGVSVLDGIDACPTGMAINLNLDNTISSGAYQATNSIESAGTIQSGSYVIFTAGNFIRLKHGFQAQAGSQFQATIENFNCVVVPNPINLVTWTSVACIESGLQFNITNATNYTVKIYSLSGQLIYNGSGSITGNSVTVWSATGASIGYYTANISFSSSISGEVISKSYTILLQSCHKNAHAFTEDNTKKLLSIRETYNDKFDFSVFPNPNDGNFTLQLLDAEDMKPYLVEIFSSLGALISKIEHCNTNQLNFNYANLPQGIYFVKLTMGVNSATKKVIIK